MEKELNPNPCEYYDRYKGIYPPRCGCQPCRDKYAALHPTTYGILENFGKRDNSL